jgi:hypothetical protein
MKKQDYGFSCFFFIIIFREKFQQQKRVGTAVNITAGIVGESAGAIACVIV